LPAAYYSFLSYLYLPFKEIFICLHDMWAVDIFSLLMKNLVD